MLRNMKYIWISYLDDGMVTPIEAFLVEDTGTFTCVFNTFRRQDVSIHGIDCLPITTRFSPKNGW